MTARSLLNARGLRAKKRFGQNFLMDGGAVLRIARLCVPEEEKLPVFEVGAGTGALTQALLSLGAQVTALEIDTDLLGLLQEREELAGASIVHADALTFDFDAATDGRPWCAAGNLPYNIATPLILRWLELQNPPQRIVAMIQKDVADRFVAKPATAAYGSLTIAVNYTTHVRRAFTLGPNAFHPRPKVESTVVVLERRPSPAVRVSDPTFFLKVVRAAFAYRRKTLANSLALALGIERARTHEVLTGLGYDTEIRGEQLDLDAFGTIADRLSAA